MILLVVPLGLQVLGARGGVRFVSALVRAVARQLAAFGYLVRHGHLVRADRLPGVVGEGALQDGGLVCDRADSDVEVAWFSNVDVAFPEVAEGLFAEDLLISHSLDGHGHDTVQRLSRADGRKARCLRGGEFANRYAASMLVRTKRLSRSSARNQVSFVVWSGEHGRW